MFFWLSNELIEIYSFLNVFKYITTRTVAATCTSGLIVFLFGPLIINYLKGLQEIGQPIRVDGPKRHIIDKAGTPTMGGLIILLGICFSSFLWADLTNKYVWIVIGITILFGTIGFYDDYLKVKSLSSNGFSAKMKIILEIIIAVSGVYLIILSGSFEIFGNLNFPFFKNFTLNIGWYFLPFGALVIISSGNAVNLTDGLDGLAIVPVMIAVSSFGFIAYITGNIIFSDYLNIIYVDGAAELSIICGAILGAGLGFLWYNAPPAMIFMGDTGSLSLGSAIGTIAIITKHELVLLIIGGLFVLEAVSVIVQVISFKITGKRVFRMAPLHHHFEEKGRSESTIVIRFWIISLILAMIGLLTLKLR
ncbi:MAG: phospho-N-acetylmuramoyl-pentapeptide-transferase [Rhodobiaceae bacterium]|nr:phospho-N-acetylmuramoyl-pentapeptide-transferase [Rhodobiaceae bacterium]